MLVDLHTHTTVSDGTLEPIELMLRAQRLNIQMLAITDHDAMGGYLAASRQVPEGMTLIPGVELSCTWGRLLVHIVGLNVDAGDTQLRTGLSRQQQARASRALLIGERLEKLGFTGSYQRADALAAGSQLGRPHFARAMVELGHVKSVKQAFKRYLGAGKPGDIKTTWPAMAEVVHWIVASGGIAVLAHPYHYNMTATKLRALISDFKAAGGMALEVLSGRQTRDRTDYLAQLCQRFELLASCGSDFHQPEQGWNELGSHGVLPDHCRPVWTQWE